MYRVMIVEDEPPLIRTIKTYIESCSSSFEVIATAHNGKEALEKIPSSMPDVVFTDIKMPVMDGITLAQRINEGYPDIFPVIISGYPDFNYARDAMKAGVVDYLLKPVDPDMISQLLLKLEKTLNDLYKLKRTELLQRVIDCNTVDADRKRRFLNFPAFLVMLTRRGALTAGTFHGSTGRSIQINGSEGTDELKGMCGLDCIVSLYGKDENEVLTVLGFRDLPAVSPESIFSRFHTMFLKNNPLQFITSVYNGRFVELGKVPEITQRIYRTIKQKLVVGKSQLIECNAQCEPVKENPFIGSNFENKAAILFQNRSVQPLKNELNKLFSVWENNSYPQVVIEKMLKQLIRVFEIHSPKVSFTDRLSLEQQLEEVFEMSASLDDIYKGVCGIIDDLLGISINRKESPEDLILRIDTYLKANIHEPLSLYDVSDKFDMSQPSLSRLFRKYKNMSFNEYITKTRISEAKRLMVEQPSLLLKDIAEMVGYQDHHYFSRVFKSLTGASPSEYRE